MLASVDAAQAISDMIEISPQVKSVVVTGADGAILGSNLADETAAQRLADGAKALVEAAEAMRPDVAQLEAATTAGSVFVVRDRGRMIAATTSPEPTVGLVFYDLKTCLRAIDDQPAEEEPEPKRRRTTAKKTEEDAGATP
jgi:predicted regulator of Ras-like GTPase activity (Roadblock/LC7/MglB family)